MTEELMLEKFGPRDIAGVFNEDEGEGFFFLYKSTTDEVLSQVRIYQHPTVPQITLEDVDIFWSLDEKEVGVALWGRMRALLTLEGHREQNDSALSGPDSPAIDDEELINFPQYIDRRKLLDARKRYWTAVLLKANPGAAISNASVPLTGTRFLRAAFDSRRTWAVVFEDEGQTGYLYLYSTKGEEILKHLHVYDCNATLAISKEDVDVVWSNDETKCAVVIWGEIYGIIDLRMNREGRVWIENRTTQGINDKTWLQGFEVI